MVFLLAYLLTGIAVVAFDFRKPFHDRPAYVRRPSQHLSMILIVVVAWLPIRVYAATRGRQWGDLISRSRPSLSLSSAAWLSPDRQP